MVLLHGHKKIPQEIDCNEFVERTSVGTNTDNAI